MKRVTGIFAGIVGSLLIVALGSYFLLARVLGNACGNEVIQVLPSPDGRMKAVSFQRDCGATTGFSTQVSVLRADQPLGNDGGNALAADTRHGDAPSGPKGGPVVRMTWKSNDLLVISRHPMSRVFLSEHEVTGVRISHIQSPGN